MSSDGGDRADDLARFGRHLIRGERSARASTAHRMRTFLLASATAAFCQPTRANNCVGHRAGYGHGACALSSRPVWRPGSTACAGDGRGLGGVPQAGLAAAGVLAGHQAEPGTELGAGLELRAVTYAGHQCRRHHQAEATQLRRRLGLRVVVHLRGDALVAPGDIAFDLDP